MRISDWSSDVCSSDLQGPAEAVDRFWSYRRMRLDAGRDLVLRDVRESDAADLLPVTQELGPAHNEKPAECLIQRVGLARTRSEERRVGKECVSTCRSWWSQSH